MKKRNDYTTTIENQSNEEQSRTLIKQRDFWVFVALAALFGGKINKYVFFPLLIAAAITVFILSFIFPLALPIYIALATATLLVLGISLLSLFIQRFSFKKAHQYDDALKALEARNHSNNESEELTPNVGNHQQEEEMQTKEVVDNLNDQLPRKRYPWQEISEGPDRPLEVKAAEMDEKIAEVSEQITKNKKRLNTLEKIVHAIEKNQKKSDSVSIPGDEHKSIYQKANLGVATLTTSDQDSTTKNLLTG